MDRIQGLKEYVADRTYRESLDMPKEVTEEYSLLGQGEYNINYLFSHPITGQKLVLRVNCGSQMHLNNQIQYEYNALQLLEPSGRTPRPFYVDGTCTKLQHGVLVMEFLEGQTLDYKRDLIYAAECLADIHSMRVGKETGLIRQKNPLEAILEECETMVKVYMDSPMGEEKKKRQLRESLNRGWKSMERTQEKEPYCCCINTELNSTNFLINGAGRKNYLIDWEKPLYGDPAQDIGHFLAQTTTFWKTDVILSKEEIESFLDEYIRVVDGRFPTEGLRDRVHRYIPITCLRGVTWCAMAWIQYQQPGKLIYNESTFQKLHDYLSEDFLNNVLE